MPVMWTRTFSKCYPEVDKKTVWRLWADVNRWAEWHGDLDYCKMEGPFEVGNHFFLKPKKVKPVKIVLKEVNEEESFTDCTAFWGAKMYDTHAMEETAKGLVLSNRITVTGPLAWLWIKLVAQGVAATVPEEMDALVDVARREGDA